MPEDAKKNQQKVQHDPKNQRKPRNRHQTGSNDKKNDKKGEASKDQTVPQPQKPVQEEPGPEFYKNLKRETDEILKITEEENSKYRKKEIQSNWAKYEMPIETYDDIEEQENLGADYEKLIEAPLSVGGHFQFKHEKSWDVDTGPTLYDKYFEVDMDNLFISVSTIPFHERINLDKTIFSETDLTMNNRATRFKQKYYKDQNYTTPELTAQDNILRSLKDNSNGTVCENKKNNLLADKETDITSIDTKTNEDIKISDTMEAKLNLLEKVTEVSIPSVSEVSIESHKKQTDDLDNFEDLIIDNQNKADMSRKEITELAEVNISKGDMTECSELEGKQNPVIESPEDLEKWLDDFLDG